MDAFSRWRNGDYSSAILGCVFAIVVLDLVGIATGNVYLQAWHPRCVTMKDTTALLFVNQVFASLILRNEGRRHAPWMLLFMSAIMFAAVLGKVNEIHKFEDLATFDPKKSYFPSIMTMFGALILGVRTTCAAFFASTAVADFCGWMLVVLGSLPLVGYVFSAPLLYYQIPFFSTPMAIPTAIVFVLLGFVHAAKIPPGPALLNQRGEFATLLLRVGKIVSARWAGLAKRCRV